MIRDWMIGD